MEEETKEIYEKAMRNAAGNLPDYNKKPIMPRQYKRKVYNEDGTSTYTFVSKRNGKEYDVKYDKEDFPLFNSKEEILLDKSFYLEGYLICGEASNGMKFMGYFRNGEITNFHPVTSFD
jgi:hypothetical protein